MLGRRLATSGGVANSRLVALRDDYEDRFRRLIADLDLPSGVDATALRLMLMGALNWSQSWYRGNGDTPAKIARNFVGFLRRPMAAKGATK